MGAVDSSSSCQTVQLARGLVSQYRGLVSQYRGSERVYYPTASLRASLYQVWERLKEAHPVKQWWEEPDKTKTGTQFFKSTNTDAEGKSTNTDAEGAATEDSFFRSSRNA